MVPFKNFLDGLPADIRANELSEDEAHAVVDNGECLDIGNNYLVDRCIPRSKLGKGVRVVTYFIGAETGMEMKLGRDEASFPFNEGQLSNGAGGQPASSQASPRTAKNQSGGASYLHAFSLFVFLGHFTPPPSPCVS